MKLLYALRFLTIIPIPYRQDEDMRQVAGSSIYYPLAGLLIGLFLYASARLLLLLFPPQAAAALLIALWAALTGGLHLDGLSDLADGMGGGRTAEQRLVIMKDSRVGAFGAITLIIFLLVKWSMTAAIFSPGTFLAANTVSASGLSLVEKFPTAPLKVIIFAPVCARLTALLGIKLYSPARPDGMGAFFKKHITWKEPVIGILFTLITGWMLFALPGVVGAATMCGVVLLSALPASRGLGGLTGDVYGALIERAELLFLLLSVAILKLYGPELFESPEIIQKLLVQSFEF
jgi:adenosylcobinamide-GDP ribazoletransferase